MTYAIRYYTRTGHTKQLADAFSEVLGVPAETTKTALSEPCDILFFGGGLYAASLDANIKSFIDSLNPELIGKAVLFTSSAINSGVYGKMRKALEARGIKVEDDNFYCKGAFKFIAAGHPDDEDIAAAKEFARKYA